MLDGGAEVMAGYIFHFDRRTEEEKKRDAELLAMKQCGVCQCSKNMVQRDWACFNSGTVFEKWKCPRCRRITYIFDPQQNKEKRMTPTQEQIEVMKAFDAGETIECAHRGNELFVTRTFSRHDFSKSAEVGVAWNWGEYIYRVKQKPPMEAQRELVARLRKDPQLILATLTPAQVDLNHAALGIATEAGELCDAIKKNVIYNKKLDTENVVEEIGDLLFYIQMVCNTLGISLDTCMTHNVLKLNKRYPTGYSDQAAQERADKK